MPEKEGDYYYYVRYEEGGQYPIYCRKYGSEEGSEEILLDVNATCGRPRLHPRWLI